MVSLTQAWAFWPGLVLFLKKEGSQVSLNLFHPAVAQKLGIPWPFCFQDLEG